MAVNNNLLLYVEPNGRPSEHPVIDEYTCTMVSAFRKSIGGIVNYFSLEPPYHFKEGDGYRGFHVCSCGVASSNQDYQLPTGDFTNSLAIHYLAYHREEISEEQLAKVLTISEDLDIPRDDELNIPTGCKGIDLERIIHDRMKSSNPIPKPSIFGDKRWAIGWEDRGLGHGDFAIIEDGGSRIIAKVTTDIDSREHANLIVTACNHHKELIAMVDEFRTMIQFRYDKNKISKIEDIEKRLGKIKELINVESVGM